MKEKIARISELSYLQIVVVFLLLVLLKELKVINLPIYYPYFILVLPLFALPILFKSLQDSKAKLPILHIALLATFTFALLWRFWPLTGSTVPLGYDPGFYKYTMEFYANALPHIPEAELAVWVKEMHPQGLPVLADVTYLIGGVDAMGTIRYLFPFLGALLVFPVFLVTRSIFGTRAGIVAALLYAVSATQFEVFTYFYLKNVLGLLFLLLAIYALEKQHYMLMALMFAALGIFHRPEFLLFALILVPYFLIYHRKEILLAFLGMALLILPFWMIRWEANWGVFSGIIEAAVTNIQTGEGLGGGTFFNLDTYTWVAVAYLPFSLIGGIHLALKKNWNSVFFLLVISAVIVIARLFFFNRFIIPLDIAVIITAAAGIDYTLLRQAGVRRAAGTIALLVLLAATLIPTIHAVAEAEPLITEEQLRAVEWLKDNTEENAYILATTNDAPWVLGWSDRRVIAPGLFEWDIYQIEEWQTFFETVDPEVAGDFLSAYGDPLYIYYSVNDDNYLGLEKFRGENFQIVYNSEDEAVVYKYRGGD